MQTSQIGLALIRRFEGLALAPYRCPAGYLTVGYGHVLSPTEAAGSITQEMADALLVRDVRRSEASVAALIRVPLSPGQFDALVSFTFNLGSAALQRSSLRHKVNRGEHDEVPEEFARWIYAGGKRLPGLVARRGAEARVYAGLGNR